MREEKEIEKEGQNDRLDLGLLENLERRGAFLVELRDGARDFDWELVSKEESGREEGDGLVLRRLRKRESTASW